nr:MAG: terminase large subunit [Caudoviricetes sp.]
MTKKLASKLDRLEAEATSIYGSGIKKMTVYGIVDMQLNVIRKWIRSGDSFVSTDEEPDMLIAERLEPLLIKKKKYKVTYGGRGGMKSMFAMDVLAAEAKDFGSSVMCFREVQKSLKESVFKGLNGEIRRLGFEGFRAIDSQAEIRHANGALFSFWGLNSNLMNMKSLYGYKRFWTEEAETISQESLDVMGPTLRGIDDAELWFTFNPKSSENPISQTFIIPFQDSLLRDGYYEDDHHLIIKVGYEHNPWFEKDKTLREELEKDKSKLENGYMSQSKFDWIWHGEFSDDVEDSIIKPEWFDAAIDAHKKLGWKPTGMKIVSYDPADMGGDAKAISIRHGSLVMDVQEKLDGDVNDATDWATNYAIDNGADLFTWDCDGLGASLRRQVTDALSGKRVEIVQFKGSESPDNAESIYQDSDDVDNPKSWRKNKDVFQKKRSQFYKRLADRFFNTYRAVHKGEYVNPDDMISLSSDIKSLAKLRAELCRIPRKANGNGYYQIMTKDEMKSKLKIKSPNMADAVMMSMLEWSPVVKPDYSNYEVPCGVF